MHTYIHTYSDDRAGLRGYVQFNKYITYIHTYINVDASRDASRARAARGGGGGGRCQTFTFIFFPCSADHERDWPPCKVVFFWVGNRCAGCEKQQKIFLLTTIFLYKQRK